MDDEKTKPEADGDDRKTGRRPRLTERQRAEARRARRSRKAGSVSKPAGGGNPLNRGIRAFLGELGRALAFLVGLVPALFRLIGSAAGSVLEAIIFIADGLFGLLAAGGRAIASLFVRLGHLVDRLDQVLTPLRATVLVCLAGCAAVLASQFIDYRAIEIGRPGYGEILDLTNAPRVEVLTPFDAHSVLVLVFGLVAAVGTLASLITGRGRPASLTAAAGLATVVVTLAADLPRGLDLGEAEIAYADAVAVLLGGFWLQLSGGAVLMVGGLVLWSIGGVARKATARAGRPAGSTA